MRDEYDFSKARPIQEFPYWEQIKEAMEGKTRITIMLDNAVIEAFKALAKTEGSGYQTLINRALRESLDRKAIDEETLRRVIREEVAPYVSAEKEK